MGKMRLASVAAVAALATVPAVVGAAPTLGAPALRSVQVVSSARAKASEPSVAVSAHGRTLAAWVAVKFERDAKAFPSCGGPSYGTVEARLGTVAGGWRRARLLGADAGGPVAAVGASGTAAVAWCSIAHGRSSLYVSIARAGHPFARARRASIDCAIPEGLEVQPSGQVIVVCSSTLEYDLTPLKTRVEVAVFPPSGGRPAVSSLGTSSPGAGVSATETEAGDVLVAFPASTEHRFTLPQDVSQLSPSARTFAAPQAIEPRSAKIIRAAALSAGPGGAALVFDASEQENEENGMSELQPDGTFGPVVPTIEPPSRTTGGQFTVEYESPRVAFPSGGQRVAVWDSTLRLPAPPGPGELGSIHSKTVFAAVRPSGATHFEAPVRLAAGRGRPGAPTITSAGASTLALWVEDEPHCKQRVYAATGALGTPSAHVHAVSGSYTPPKGECEGNGTLTLAGSGRNAIAGWIQGHALHITTQTGSGT